MTILLAGGEDLEFSPLGTGSIDTATTAARNTTRSRCALKIGPCAANSLTEGWLGQLSTPSSVFWTTMLGYSDYNGNGIGDAIAFFDGATRRLVIKPVSNLGAWALYTRNAAGTYTLLYTSSATVVYGTLLRFDVYVNYAVAGQVIVYLNGVKIIDYSGDVTTNGATTLSAVMPGQISGQVTASSSGSTWWSEIIAATVDTRSMRLVTLPPAGSGNTTAWTGGTTTTNINEVTLSDATLISSGTAGQVNEFTVTSSGITGNPGIVGVVVNARAQKGGTGPTKADLMVRTASTDYVSADIPLAASFGLISNTWETNPNTAGPWSASDLTAAGFNVGVKSVT
jgi:hypothetical protein